MGWMREVGGLARQLPPPLAPVCRHPGPQVLKVGGGGVVEAHIATAGERGCSAQGHGTTQW